MNWLWQWPGWSWPGWVALAGVGTVGTLIAALYQLSSQRRRREQEQHREQARLIAGWVGRGDKEADRTPLFLANGSPEPVYNVVCTIVNVQGAAPRTGEEWRRVAKQSEPDHLRTPITTATILPPGRWQVWIAGYGWHQRLSGRVSAEVAFTDRAGSHWVRRANGDLEELTEPPFKHFALVGPYELVTPDPID